MELYKKYRPQNFVDVVGQKEALRALASMLKRQEVPHTLLFTGPSGCGKTTLARILKQKLNCADVDFEEKNGAEDRGIDMARDIGKRMLLKPIGGSCRVYLIDEAHQLTSAGQDCLLKMLEDTPNHVYFFLATTDPNKLKQTIRTRCTEIKVSLLKAQEAEQLIQTVVRQEGLHALDESVVEALVEHAAGSARKLLVALHKILGITGAEKQLQLIQKQDVQRQAIELARILVSPKNATWKQVAEILKNLDEEPETIRRMILGYCDTILLSAGKLTPRAAALMSIFAENFYDTGKPGLDLACYEIFHQED